MALPIFMPYTANTKYRSKSRPGVHEHFPPRALKLVVEWKDLHKAELIKTGNWPSEVNP